MTASFDGFVPPKGTQSKYWMPNLQKVLIYEGQSSKARPKFQQRQGSSKGSSCVYIFTHIDIFRFKCICSIVIVVHISTIDWLLLPSYGVYFYILIDNLSETGWHTVGSQYVSSGCHGENVITTRWSCLVWRWFGWPNVWQTSGIRGSDLLDAVGINVHKVEDGKLLGNEIKNDWSRAIPCVFLLDVYVFKTVHYNWTSCVYHTEYFKSWCPCTQSSAEVPAKIPVVLSHSWLLEGPLQSWRCTLHWLVRDLQQWKWFQRETN